MNTFIKHITPYVGTNVLIKVKNKPNYRILVGVNTLTNSVFDNMLEKHNFKDIKLVLRPLSELVYDTSFFDFLETYFQSSGAYVTIFSREHLHFVDVGGVEYLIHNGYEVSNQCPYLIYKWLLENHYDVFGLFEKELATKIN